MSGAANGLSQLLRASLHGIGMYTPDPVRSAEFYERALGYEFVTNGDEWVGAAIDRNLTLIVGPAKSLAWAAYAVADGAQMRALRSRLEAANWPHEEVHDPRYHELIALKDPDGSGLCFGLPVAPPPRQLDGGRKTARLQHFVNASRAPERIVAFFHDVLGFAISDDVRDENGGLRASFLRCSDEHHAFAIFKAPEDRFDHHCYEVRDWNEIRDWADHFAAARIPIIWGPGRHGPGNNLFLFVNDPDGNWVELSTELEVIKPGRTVGVWPHEERTLDSWGRGILRS